MRSFALKRATICSFLRRRFILGGSRRSNPSKKLVHIRNLWSEMPGLSSSSESSTSKNFKRNINPRVNLVVVVFYDDQCTCNSNVSYFQDSGTGAHHKSRKPVILFFLELETMSCVTALANVSLWIWSSLSLIFFVSQISLKRTMKFLFTLPYFINSKTGSTSYFTKTRVLQVPFRNN